MRLEDVRGRVPPTGHAPLRGVRVEVQGELRLGTGEGELAGLVAVGPGRAVEDQAVQAAADVLLVDRDQLAAADCLLDPFGQSELNGTGDVLADVGEQRERTVWRDLELGRPAVEHDGVLSLTLVNIRKTYILQ
ncbi:MAG: hypothetical protein QOK10_3601 [Pseudonocardiales bacterium]|nr:hypothetical protein [Pseudonocardiales bacterium]